MSLLKFNSSLSFQSSLWQRAFFTSLGLLGLATVLHGQSFITLDLPLLNAEPPHFGAVAISHLPDGRFIYGNNNALYLQNTFGAANVTAFATPPGVDPSFVTVLNGTTAVVGAGGGFGNTPLYQFNPSTPATPGYTSITSTQNYAAAPAGAGSLYITGLNGGEGDNALSYVTLGGNFQNIIDPAGSFSSGVAVDGGGNVYVGDYDTNGIYEFSAAQIATAIGNNATLTFSNGTLLHTFSADVVGSLAVDSEGRIWATGFGADGIFWYDPSDNASGVLNPQAAGGAYTVSTFSAGGNNYMSYVWQSGYDDGDSVVYGYNTVQNVPEPANWPWLAGIAAGLVAWRRRKTAKPGLSANFST